jgi:diguanylate cyclase (GGDEF)-like protein
MESRLTGARSVMYGAIGVALVLCGPSLGWWTLAPLMVAVFAYLILQRRLAASERPEYVVAATVGIAQLMIGVGIAMTGGPRSPALPLLLLSIVTLPARFGTHGVQAGVAATLTIMLGATLGVDPAVFIAHPQPVIFAAAAIIGLAVFGDGLMRAEVESRSTSAQDTLTGLLNRKALATHFAELAQQAELNGRCLCLVLVDLDHFKAVNDDYGHLAGDDVLSAVAKALRGEVREHDVVGRFGGEEFVVLLPELGRDLDGSGELHAIAERIRHRISTLNVTVSAPNGAMTINGLSVSVGGATFPDHGVGLEQVLEAADAALYEAKRDGRNAVRIAASVVPRQRSTRL